jgi:hypothetical protein
MGIISAGASAVPFPGVDVVADLAIIAHEIYFYMNEFGLDEESLRHLCKKISSTSTNYHFFTVLSMTKSFKVWASFSIRSSSCLRKCMHAPYDTAHETIVPINGMYLANFPAILSLAWVLITSINNLLITVFS